MIKYLLPLGMELMPRKNSISYSFENTPSKETERAQKKRIDYYPFGLQHGKANAQAGSSNLGQQYKFGGKEYQPELGLDWYDVSARNYDPALGRWMNIDPLAEVMRSHSPFNYGFNNPLRFIDPDGMMARDITLSQNLTEDERNKILNDLQQLTDDTLVYNSETNQVEIGEEGSGDKTSGTQLVRDLINHDKNVTISTSDAGYLAGEEGTIESDSPDSANASNGVGVNSEVTVGKYERKFLTQDESNDKVNLETIPSHIALGHELIHANAIMDGNSSERNVNYYYNDGKGTVRDRASLEELRTIGISGYPRLRGNYPTENQLRRENGFNLRISYGTKRFK